mmetsp:Transcript_11535/g.48287  ORF Transcript_11535/g.48287 Transcript_11535/m.48287 type:complete len:297 (-) Transcript_11535:384-1274(-)
MPRDEGFDPRVARGDAVALGARRDLRDAGRGRRGGRRRQGRVGGSDARIWRVVSGGDDVRGRRARGATRGDDGGAHPLPARGLVGRPSARRARRASRRRRRHERGFRCVGRRRKPNATLIATRRDDRLLPAHEGGVGTREGRRPRGSRDTRRAVRGGDGDAAFGGASRRSRAVCRPQARRDVHPRGRRRRRRRKRRPPGLPRRRVHRPGVAPTSRRHREARRVRIARSDWVVGASRSVGLADDDGDDEGRRRRAARATRPGRGEEGVRCGVPDASVALGRGSGRGGRGGDRAARGF